LARLPSAISGSSRSLASVDWMKTIRNGWLLAAVGANLISS
jgi:hypothetical protein